MKCSWFTDHQERSKRNAAARLERTRPSKGRRRRDVWPNLTTIMATYWCVKVEGDSVIWFQLWWRVGKDVVALYISTNWSGSSESMEVITLGTVGRDKERKRVWMIWSVGAWIWGRVLFNWSLSGLIKIGRLAWAVLSTKLPKIQTSILEMTAWVLLTSFEALPELVKQVVRRPWTSTHPNGSPFIVMIVHLGLTISNCCWLVVQRPHSFTSWLSRNSTNSGKWPETQNDLQGSKCQAWKWSREVRTTPVHHKFWLLDLQRPTTISMTKWAWVVQS